MPALQAGAAAISDPYAWGMAPSLRPGGIGAGGGAYAASAGKRRHAALSTWRTGDYRACVDKAGRVLGATKISAPGLFDDQIGLQREVEAEFENLLSDLPLSVRQEDAALTDAARAILRRITGKRLGKRPIVEAHILRL